MVKPFWTINRRKFKLEKGRKQKRRDEERNKISKLKAE